MAEVLFYHLTQSTLDRALPDMLDRALARGWKVVVRAGNAARVGALDDMLWSFDDASFLPHGRAGDDHAEHQPVYLTAGPENPAGAEVLMLVDGARVDPGEAQGYARTCLIFNGHEPGALDAARADWVAVKDAGLPGKYWAQEDGRWVQKAASG